MKTIGMIGGLSWESSLEYYRIINQAVKARLGGLHSADCLMYSFDFAEIEALQAAQDWDEATRRMVAAAQRVERGGAACIVICSNTMHRMADAVQAAVHIPLLHIADATADTIRQHRIKDVGLLGTRFTMEEDFYRGRLSEKFGLNVIVPDDDGRKMVDRIIYEELVVGEFKPESRAAYTKVIEDLRKRGAAGVILGCTEIELLIQAENSSVPVFDTTYLHAMAAVEFALA